MKKPNSIKLLILGCLLLPIGVLTKNPYVLSITIVINIVAIVLSFKEKKEKNK